MKKYTGALTYCDSIEMMSSDDHQERFLAEYIQLRIRISKLSILLTKYELTSSTKIDYLGFKPACSYDLLNRQFRAMIEYRHILEERAIIEKIPLPPIAC